MTDKNCDPNSREARMVTLRRDETGRPAVWCDPEIADIVQALNAGGVPTVASCSGHRHRPGDVALRDGRWLVVAADHDEWRRIEALFPTDINGETSQPARSEDDVQRLVEGLREAVELRAALCRFHNPIRGEPATWDGPIKNWNEALRPFTQQPANPIKASD